MSPLPQAEVSGGAALLWILWNNDAVQVRRGKGVQWHSKSCFMISLFALHRNGTVHGHPGSNFEPIPAFKSLIQPILAYLNLFKPI